MAWLSNNRKPEPEEVPMVSLLDEDEDDSSTSIVSEQLENGFRRRKTPKFGWKPYENSWFPEKYRFIQSNRAKLAWFFHDYSFRKIPVVGRLFPNNGTLVIIFILFILLLQGCLSFQARKAKKTGKAPEIAMVLVFLFSTRKGFLQFIVGIPFERALKAHYWLGYVTVFLSILHGCHACTRKKKRTFDPHTWKLVYWTGWISTFAMFLLVLTSFPFIRRYLWNFFHLCHWIFFVIAAFFAAIHGSSATWACIAFFFLDIAYRIFSVLQKDGFTQEVQLTCLPADVVRISFPYPKPRKGRKFPPAWEYEAGQWIGLSILDVGAEIHPLSISSSPPPAYKLSSFLQDSENNNNDNDNNVGHLSSLQVEDVTIHMRVLGDWSRKVYELASRNLDQDGSVTVKAVIEGPYGAVSQDLEGDRYKHFLLICGGIGITPLQSVCNHLLEQHGRGRPITYIWFVWAVRDDYLIGAVRPHVSIAKEETANSAQRFGSATSNKLPLPISFQPDLLSVHAQGIGNHEGRDGFTSHVLSTPTSDIEGDNVKFINGKNLNEGNDIDVPSSDIINNNSDHTIKNNNDDNNINNNNINIINNIDGNNNNNDNNNNKNNDNNISYSDNDDNNNDSDSDNYNNADILQTDFYLTQPRDTEDFEQGRIFVGPNSGQQCNFFGRPDIAAICRKMAGLAKNEKVAVMVCGPELMVAEVERQAFPFSNMDVHSELFNF